MTDGEIRLLRETHEALLPMADALAAQVFDRVVERAPGAGARPPYGPPDGSPDGLPATGAELAALIGGLLESPNDPPRLLALLEPWRGRLGGGAQAAAQLELIGAALIDTLAVALGRAFTPAHRRAWARLQTELRTALATPPTG